MLKEGEEQVVDEIEKDVKSIGNKAIIDEVDNVLKSLLPKMASQLMHFSNAVQYLLKASVMQQEQINRLNEVLFPGEEQNVCTQGPL